MIVKKIVPRRLCLRPALGGIALLFCSALWAADGPLGIELLYRLDQLAKLRPVLAVGCVSTYDRTGGNDDGFSGKYSFVRKEADGLVMADLEGPGVIYRIWTATPTDDWLEFYFDGEASPRIRIRFRQLFTGEVEPFLRPLVGYGAGGFYSYLPIAYAKSCKIVARAEQIQFYQINFADYPAASGIESYSGYRTAAEREQLERARQLLGAAGSDISDHLAPPGTRLTRERISGRVEAGESITLWQAKKGGRIAGFRLRPASAFADKSRRSVLRFYWDDDTRPALNCPAGDLFGYSWGEPAVRSLLLGTSGETDYLFFPMPFDRSARIELFLEAGPAIEVEGEVGFADLPRQPGEGKFYALWHRENPTTLGRPFTFVETNGTGHVVGAILQAQGLEAASTGFFEGDDQAEIDGKPAVHGTGSEDFFNGGWYNVPGRWMSRLSFPLSGCLDYKNALSRTGGYRLMIADSYSFRENIKLTIEHAPRENNLETDYTAVTYLYAVRPPTMESALPNLAARAVRHPEKIVFSPGWSVPLDSFSLGKMTLTKQIREIDGERIRYLSVVAEGEDRFGPHHLAFRCELPEAGRYRVSMEALKGPDQGIVQIYRQERAEGQSIDLYNPLRERSGLIVLADLEMDAGENPVVLKLIGKQADSKALGLDLVSLVFTRLQ